jgi:transposase
MAKVALKFAHDKKEMKRMKPLRKMHTAEFKAQVAMASLRENISLPDLAKRFDVHPNLIYKWRRHLVDNAARLFSGVQQPAVITIDASSSEREELLLKKIGELIVERDFRSAKRPR